MTGCHGTVGERFWRKVEKTEACWLWVGYRKPEGYGTFKPDTGTRVQAHRWAYEGLVGPIPDGLQLDHLCRNRACVRPDHLEPVTPAENSRRGIAGLVRQVARQAISACKHGHPYDYVRNDGARRCLTCHRDEERRRRARLKEPA